MWSVSQLVKTGSEVILTLVKSSHRHPFDDRLGDKCAADFQKSYLRDKWACEIVYGAEHNVGFVIIYLRLSDFLQASTAYVVCPEDSPLDYIVAN